jgi:uncharacterized protein (DUF2336 family)
MTKSLSAKDVERLLNDPSPDHRSELAGKIASEFNTGALTASERQIAEQIFAVMVRDAEARVRKTLAENLKGCPDIARDVAISLAKDIDEVSLPILRHSSVLSDDDLVEIVRSGNAIKQTAIAGRDRVSSAVADALIETENEDVVSTLVSNQGAEISEASMGRILDTFPDSDSIKDPLVHRQALPVAVAERLVTLVSARLKDHLLNNHDLPSALISDLIMQTRERATLSLLSPASGDDQVRRLVTQLYRNGRLTPSIVLRSLCMGDIAFFETSLAILAQVPLANTRRLIHDNSSLGLTAILEKAGIPTSLHKAFQVGVDVVRENEYDGGEHDRERFKKRMIERILTNFGDPNAHFGAENIEYLLTKLSSIGSEIGPGNVASTQGAVA